MPLESFNLIPDLDPTWPLGTDNVSQGDDHMRGIKSTLQNQFPNLTDPVTATSDELNSGGLPTGSLVPFGGAAAPDNFLLCDGAAVDRTTYSDLYTVILDTYGEGNGSTTFNVPDMRDRVPGGVSATNTAGSEVGKDEHDSNDVIQHNHTTTSNGAHTHDLELRRTGVFGDGPYTGLKDEGPYNLNGGAASAGAHTHTVNNTGSATVDNRQATLYHNWIIKI